MEPLRLAVIGAGAIAQRNATEAAASGVCSIAGVFDLNVKVAREMAQRLGVPVFASYEEALADRKVDAVLLSTPHHVHRSNVVDAAAARKHVMVEKPLATTLADAEEMIAACRRADVALTVNYSFRYLPKVRKARELVQSGAIGDVVGVQIVSNQYLDPGYWVGARSNSPDDWRSSREKCGGGHLIMVVCHAIDYMYYITGMRGTRVYCEYTTAASPGDVEDTFSLTCRWGDRGVGSVVGTSVMRGAEWFEERVWGTRGTIVLNGDGLTMYSTRPIDGKRPGQVHQYRKFPNVSWTAEWVRGFVTAIRERREPEISMKEGWENLAFITSAYESMREGRAIDVPVYSEDLVLR
jgi:UDP-N-acetyl-2-amino-2-deoxyglucuronate dehydrogenase